MLRRIPRFAAGILVLVLPLTLVLAPKADAVSATCAEFTAQVTSLLNPSSGARLLTQYEDEATSSARFGFTASEGTVFAVAPTAGQGLVPVWRTFNPVTYDFTWAAEGTDLSEVLASGYQKQHLQFFASTVDNACTERVYRLQKGGDTRMVHGTKNRDDAVREGWTVSRSTFWAPPPGTVSPPPPVMQPPAGTDDSFTIVAIPDTQQETWSDGDTRMRNRSQWIADNANAQDIAFVTHVGDVVDWGAVAPEQYTRARNGMAPLNGRVPWSTAVGNHDTAAVCAGGSACPGANSSVTVRDTKAFNKAFPGSTFSNLAGQFEAGKIDNSFHTFAAGGQNWLMLNLELWPRAEAVAWARSVVSSHPRHNIIISTHAYLNSNGSIGQTNGGYGSTSPQYLFDNLVKLYPNIVMVLSGHTGAGASRVDTGVNGNKIVSLLQCYHSRTTNPTRLISFDISERSITHWVYAPMTNETLQGKASLGGMDFTR